MKIKYHVSTLHLNFRRTPSSQSRSNIIALLPLHQKVLIEEEDLQGVDKWIAIQTSIADTVLRGFVAYRYLAEGSAPSSGVAWNEVGPVHMPENIARISRNYPAGRAYPIGEPDRPGRNLESLANGVESLHKIVEWLNVGESLRYKPGRYTYCNIYAYDYCYLAGVYLPRVWWTEDALCRLWRNKTVKAQYDKTLKERNANSIFDWYKEFSEDFGWRRVFSEEEIQQEVNQGKIGVMVAKRRKTNYSGHITVVVPETDTQSAYREEGQVVIPLQSQAGRNNRQYFSEGYPWHRHARYIEFGFWVHD